MTDDIHPHLDDAIRAAFDGMKDGSPKRLMPRIDLELDEYGVSTTEHDVIAALEQADANAPARKAAHRCLAKWDSADPEGWSRDTEPKSAERRQAAYEALALSTTSRDVLDRTFPTVAQRDVIISQPGPWEPWYTAERRQSHDFYWRAYRGVLERKGWAADAIQNLDDITTDIVGRLADPTSETSYQSKGLVVGHVQSGKTANFTGTIAKAIDAGYRLVIVLTGTVELLRGQTQRRLDQELVGEENILGGRDPRDPEAVRSVDYISDDDIDWRDGKFLKHGIDINSAPDVPGIKRLTTASGDYKALKAGLDTLDFRRTGELRAQHKPLYDPKNLFTTDIRLAVVKKNKSVLKKILRDLHDVHASLAEIPVLIIDDEADQASVNTTRPRTGTSKEDRERTAINELISRLLSEMPRAQYIGYTATPFANVFISPEDSEDIFPKDFIIALDPPAAYMGGDTFHDLHGVSGDERADPSVSNEAAFVRDLRSADDEDSQRDDMQEALDAFVLSGAIKLWRAQHGEAVDSYHHTMLVHQSVKVDEHTQLAQFIREVWKTADYAGPAGLARLRSLYVNDFAEVHVAREWGTRLPSRFDDLKVHIGEALDLIGRDSDPVVIVNGSKESEYRAMDFATGRYWRIMVGGAKLSRGFTLEGLTVSYYRRKAGAADTLMQMGRWFGFRPGYGDLVRLYIARNITDKRGKIYDLYDAFTAIVQDENDFREQLSSFTKVDEDGRPEMRPIDVPPLVFQQLPWLKPTSASKMYNAVLEHQGEGGQLKDFPRQAERGDGSANREHFEAVREWLEKLSEPVEFEYEERPKFGWSKTRTFNARFVIVSAEDVYNVLEQFHWAQNYSFAPTQRFLSKAMDRGELEDWAVLVPDLKKVRYRDVDGVSVPLLARTRRDRGGFSGSSFRQRAAIERIAGNTQAPGGPKAEDLYRPTRGGLLLTFAADPDSRDKEERKPENLQDPISPRDVATIFSLAVPYESAPRGRIGFRVQDESRRDDAIIDVY